MTVEAEKGKSLSLYMNTHRSGVSLRTHIKSGKIITFIFTRASTKWASYQVAAVKRNAWELGTLEFLLPISPSPFSIHHLNYGARAKLCITTPF
jgi:hypothetical protein